jgi:hypothetical protein
MKGKVPHVSVRRRLERSTKSRRSKTHVLNFTFMLPCIAIDLFLDNQQDALIILIYSVIKFSGRFGQQIRNTWKVLKCGAGEGWRRSVGPIM